MKQKIKKILVISFMFSLVSLSIGKTYYTDKVFYEPDVAYSKF